MRVEWGTSEYLDAMSMIDKRFYIDEDQIIRCNEFSYKGNRAFVGIRDKCGKLFLSFKERKNCSRSCAMKVKREYVAVRNKSEEMRRVISLRNMKPEFREKVSRGLKARKQLLGENYHSKETRKKIGQKTVERWEQQKEKLLKILINNGDVARKDTKNPYISKWDKLSKKLRKEQICSRCGTETDLALHHIIPARFGGENVEENTLVLCRRCHPIVDAQQIKIFQITESWELTALLVKSVLFKEMRVWK